MKVAHHEAKRNSGELKKQTESGSQPDD